MDNSTETPMRRGMESDSIDLLSVLRIARSAGGALCTQASLYSKLAWVEWQEEKTRLFKICVFGLLGFACLLCAMLFIGLMVLVVSWNTPYRFVAPSIIIVLYGVGIAIAWQRIHALSMRNSQSFAATRAELATDLALIKSRL